MTHALQFLGGLVLLLTGGRLLVSAAVDSARRLGVSPLVVGLTLVAWGTSAREFALNLSSAWKGRGDLALGNVVGANICNMGLVLGLCALIRPLQVSERLINVEVWLNALILVFMAALGLVSGFARWEAGLMLGVFAAYSAWTVASALRESRGMPAATQAAILGPDPAHPGPPMGWTMIAACFAGGMALLSFGGALASDGAAAMAIALGVSTAIVGVTVVSIGTTLPELMTSVLAVRKGQIDLAMGNAIGSCIFNAGAVFGLTGLLAPPVVDRAFILPLAYMAVLALALIPMSRTFGKKVARVEGAILLASYALFLALTALGLRAGSPPAASFPTRPGIYAGDVWRYDYSVTAPSTRSERRIGRLFWKGDEMTGAIGEVRTTSLGQFAYFGRDPKAYNRGCLNTLAYDRPVFGPGGQVLPTIQSSFFNPPVPQPGAP